MKAWRRSGGLGLGAPVVPPSLLVLTSPGGIDVDLVWDWDSPGDPDSFTVENRINGGPWVTVGIISPGVLRSHSWFPGCSDGDLVQARVMATVGGANSSWTESNGVNYNP